MPKISDIIEVPPVKTVIELSTVRNSEAESAEQLTELLETFVVTDDIERNLRVVLDRIARHPDAGMGFFLTDIRMQNSRCKKCGWSIDGVGLP